MYIHHSKSSTSLICKIFVCFSQNISEDTDISNFTGGSQAKYCYDAVWTLALALNKTVTGIPKV